MRRVDEKNLSSGRDAATERLYRGRVDRVSSRRLPPSTPVEEMLNKGRRPAPRVAHRRLAEGDDGGPVRLPRREARGPQGQLQRQRAK